MRCSASMDSSSLPRLASGACALHTGVCIYRCDDDDVGVDDVDDVCVLLSAKVPELNAIKRRDRDKEVVEIWPRGLNG